jgi:hypothetical protein
VLEKSGGNLKIVLWAAALLLLLLADIVVGGTSLGFAETVKALTGGGAGLDMMSDRQAIALNIVWAIRVPRVAAALLSGALLALSGVQMQAVFRNPLADPHIMGVSAGAGTGAAIAAISIHGLSLSAVTEAGSFATGMTMASAAFVGAVFSSLIIIYLSGKIRNGGILLIAGVLLGFIFSAITSLIEFSANQESLKLFYSWAAGSFSGCGKTEILLMGAALLAGTVMCIANSQGLDIILFGDEFAESAGASVRRIRLWSMLGCCIMTGAVTAFCGPIGFLGIVSPHIARAVLKTSVHRHVIPMTMLVGASIAVAGDILSQCTGVMLPVGSTIALIGIPIIAVILLGQSKRIE